MSRNHAAIDWRSLALWRRAVLTRDNWRCQSCGGYGNEAHHLKPLAYNPALALDVANGQTLCRACHITMTRKQTTLPERLRFRNYLDTLARE